MDEVIKTFIHSSKLVQKTLLTFNAQKQQNHTSHSYDDTRSCQPMPVSVLHPHIEMTYFQLNPTFHVTVTNTFAFTGGEKKK